jgi:hypothetical protein
VNIIRIPKKTPGQFRTIYAPGRKQKRALRALVPELTAIAARLCPVAHAFLPGRCPTTNALAHAGRQHTVCWDLRDFFDSVRPEHVEQHLTPDVLEQVFVDGAPRQGLPTSPAVANIAAAELDQAILAYLDGLGVYTRYADDLCISVDDRELLPELLRDIPRIVARHGFAVHPGKTHVQHAGSGRRVICGVAVDDGVNATRAVRRRLRAAEHNASTTGDHKAGMQARGLREWCAMRLPIAAELQRLLGGRVPPPALLRALGLAGAGSRDRRGGKRRVVRAFPAKAYLRAVRHIAALPTTSDAGKNEIVGWATALACTFGHAWSDWIKVTAAAGVSLHDACHWLPANVLPDDGLGSRLLAWRRDVPGVLARISDLALVARHWHTLRGAERSLGLAELLTLARAKRYADATHVGFAAQAQKAGVSERAYKGLESKWLRGLQSLTYEAIPRAEVTVDGYTAKVLDRDDPRGLWIGQHTACCQHPIGEGASSAWHGALRHDGAILAIEHDGAIVAQSWLWRKGDVIVADNVETLTGHAHKLPAVYEAWAAAMLGRLCVADVRVGTRGDIDVSGWAEATAIPGPTGCYTDARSQRSIAREVA